ncbi:MAG TPA: hypothetical protein DCE41_00260 [Cytophagales bacterium]|nr:hypothetical protein [Cytophagales bacterium]HAA22939.1 hypothetical protein [Cytophagales bacterium]HAP62593.1 hypothetical protein [Cytophagales bacterium]
MKDALNPDQWAHWEPIIRTKSFTDLSSVDRKKALSDFGSQAIYERYRRSMKETRLLAEEPIPPLRSEVKKSLDTAWAEQTQPQAKIWWLRPTLPSYQWAAACILFLLLGWSLRSIRPVAPQIVYETVVDTLYHTLPPDTIRVVEVERVEVPVRIVEYRPLADSTPTSNTQPGRPLSDDPELWQWMLSETE